MVRQAGLALFENLNQFSNGQIAMAQQGQNPEPGRFSGGTQSVKQGVGAGQHGKDINHSLYVLQSPICCGLATPRTIGSGYHRLD
jgi:hypothetical protein